MKQPSFLCSRSLFWCQDCVHPLASCSVNSLVQPLMGWTVGADGVAMQGGIECLPPSPSCRCAHTAFKPAGCVVSKMGQRERHSTYKAPCGLCCHLVDDGKNNNGWLIHFLSPCGWFVFKRRHLVVGRRNTSWVQAELFPHDKSDFQKQKVAIKYPKYKEIPQRLVSRFYYHWSTTGTNV